MAHGKWSRVLSASSRLHARQRGDTIIEVMVSLAILSTVIGAAYSSAVRSLQAGQRAQERTEALKYAESQIERIKYVAADESSGIFDGGTNDYFCLNASNQKVAIANKDDFNNYGECAQPSVPYFINVNYDSANQNLFTVTATWKRVGGGGSSSGEGINDTLQLFYRQPPDLAVVTPPPPVVPPPPMPPPPPPPPPGSRCWNAGSRIQIGYIDGNPGFGRFDTGIDVPAGTMTPTSYVSKDHNWPTPQAHEQWHIRIGTATSADTLDIPDYVDPSGDRMITGSLPAFTHGGGRIILEHYFLNHGPPRSIDSVRPDALCFTNIATPTPPPPPPPPLPCDWSVGRSKQDSYFSHFRDPTPPGDPIGANDAFTGYAGRGGFGASFYFGGLRGCSGANSVTIRLRTRGAWRSPPDLVEVALRREGTTNTFLGPLPPGSGAGWAWVPNTNQGIWEHTYQLNGANPNDLELIVLVDGDRYDTGWPRGIEYIHIEPPIIR